MKTEQRIQNAIKWINELSTTTEKQGKGQLGDDIIGFCCLGLGCSILGIDYHTYHETNSEFTESVGLITDEGYIYRSDYNYPYSLADANDQEDWSFKKISEFLKSNPEKVFIKEVAEGIKKHYES